MSVIATTALRKDTRLEETMKTLLQIKSSIFSDGGQSSRLADRFVAAWRNANPGARVIVRDLALEPVPHLDAARFGAFLSKVEERSVDQQQIVDYSDVLIEELRNADVVVLGVPMYNFGVPSSLKAYFDHIARAGVTFRYTAEGPQGLLTGKRVVAFATRGGLHAGTASDTQTGFIRTFLGFLGMTDIEFVYAEGLAISDEQRASALAEAHATIDDLAGAEAIAA
jgi:FMN-dependent NADH-azoreductase